MSRVDQKIARKPKLAKSYNKRDRSARDQKRNWKEVE